MEWKENAVRVLQDSLNPVPTELNNLDWKSGLSPKSDRLAQHVSAFANQEGGGMFVFGVSNDGSLNSINKEQADKIITTLGNIAKNNLVHSIVIEHNIINYRDTSLLFIYIPEQMDKPIHLKGPNIFNSYCRSAGQTVKMSREQVRMCIAHSERISFETQIAKRGLTNQDVLEHLSYKIFYNLIDKKVPGQEDDILQCLASYNFCSFNKNKWDITNLGAILFAKDISLFGELYGRSVIVRKYKGTNNRDIDVEIIGTYGYAVGFEGLIDFIMTKTSIENISTLRESLPIYPRIAIRELVANALVHQDFSITGVPIIIEIFSNRLSIINPGAPLNDINRLIDLPPISRNEKLAQSLFLFGICERRGSGIDRAVAAIEEMFLPAIKITKSEQYTKVILFPEKDISKMTKDEKIEICYQHACLLNEDLLPINNKSIRERFKLDSKKSSVASRIIADTLEIGLIKLADGNTGSKKFVTYIPFYS